MKNGACLLAALLMMVLASSPWAEATDAPQTPAGHWEGAIALPTTALGIRVDLSRNGDAWQGSIDIPVQELHGFRLDPVKVDGAAVEFVMPGIPGTPHFVGHLADHGGTLAGEFSQGGGRFPFKLERKAPPAPTDETPARGIPGDGLVGHWQGTLRPSPVIELRLALEIRSTDPGQPAGVLISLDQGNARIPITALTEHDGAVHLECRRVGGVFDGKLNADGSEMAGEWSQGGGALPLVFKRTGKAVSLTPPSRPQEPKPPFPYPAEDVEVGNPTAGVTLAGTLTLPPGPGPHPAVVLITGSGPQDRDEAIMGHRPFLVLADYLTRRGIAVLRCDDRGVGKSAGDFAKATDADFVSDTLAEVAYLRTRREIDPGRIGLIGHSEGGIVAPRAAVASPDIAFIVLMAGPGLPMEDILLRQVRDHARVMGAGAEQVDKSVALERGILDMIKSKRDPAEIKKAVHDAWREETASLTADQKAASGHSEALIDQQIQMALSPWFRDLLDYDPRPTLRRVKCPVLAINGEKDLQVAADENLPAIRAALEAGGNRDFRIVPLPGLNHLFQKCQTGAATEYRRIAETLDPAAPRVIGDWILQVTAH